MVYAHDDLPESPTIYFLNDLISVRNMIAYNHFVGPVVPLEPEIVCMIHAVATGVKKTLEAFCLFGFWGPQIVHFLELKDLLLLKRREVFIKMEVPYDFLPSQGEFERGRSGLS
jgi:hypothetical protein